MERENNKQNIQIAVVIQRLDDLRENLKRIESNMVTKTEFNPIKKFYDQIRNLSLGALIALGAIVFGALTSLKDKFIN